MQIGIVSMVGKMRKVNMKSWSKTTLAAMLDGAKRLKSDDGKVRLEIRN